METPVGMGGAFRKSLAQVGDEALVRLCLLEWRLEKETLPNRPENRLFGCKGRLQPWEEGGVKRVRQTVRWLFGQVARASSLVETVNSWRRPFLWLCLGEWARYLQSTHVVLEYPSVLSWEAARENTA